MATPKSPIRASSTSREYWKFVGLLVFIAMASTLMSTLISFSWDSWLRWFMGGLLLVFGSFKLIGYENFVSVFPQYDLIAVRHPAYAYIYPVVEVLLGIFFVLNMAPWPRDVLALLIYAVGSFGVFQNLSKRGPTFYAVCLGNAIKLPLSTVMLFEDFIMTVMALLLLFIRP